MKIDTPIATALSTVLQGTTAQERQTATAAAVIPPSASKVQLSLEMKALEEKLSLQKTSISTFDAQKVESIRGAIAAGRFQVNAANVADGLVASVQELIRNNPQLGAGPVPVE